MIYIDQMMREVRLDKPPSRIICLVPSITELLCELGLDERIAGITKFCIHPDHIFKSKPKVGGTKKADHQKIDMLQPDLIIANKEENTKADIEILEKKYPVWISDVTTLDDAIDMIHKLGELNDKKSLSGAIANKILNEFSSLKPLNHIRTLYLIWRSPYMAAGQGTFINDLMSRCGLANVLTIKTRYPELTTEEIRDLNPSLVLLSSEPYPFKDIHISEIKSILPDSEILLADGEYFSWYGSRVIGSPAYFKSLLKLVASNRQNARYEN